MANKKTLLSDYLKQKKNDKQEAETKDSASKSRSSLLKDYLSQEQESSETVPAKSLSERLTNPSYRSSPTVTVKSLGETQRGDGSQTTDLRLGETRRGNKPEASLLEKIQYVQAVGADAFAAANENLNNFGEAIYSGLKGMGESFLEEKSFPKAAESAYQGFTESLDKAAEENINARARRAIDDKYGHVVNAKGVKTAADLVSGFNAMLPAMALPGAAGTTWLAATNLPESYISARNNGADQKQALAYAGINSAINSVGEQLIGGIASKGAGLAGKAANFVTRGAASRLAANAMNSLAKSPIAKTLLSSAAKSAGEGVEEVVQGALSTAAERATYNPEAKLDANSLVYEGLIGGLMGGAFQLVNLPATYQAYRSDYDTVNGISLAGAAVTSDSDVKVIKSIGESIVKGADEILADKSTDADQKQRAQYVKSGVEATLKRLDDSSADIIAGNQKKYTALENLVSSNPANVRKNLAVFVRDVAGNTAGGKDAINKTVDFVRGEIQNMDNVIATSSDASVVQEARINRQNYAEIDKALRSYRKEINKDLTNLPAQETEPIAQTAAQTESQADTTTGQAKTTSAAETAAEPEVSVDADVPVQLVNEAETYTEQKTAEPLKNTAETAHTESTEDSTEAPSDSDSVNRRIADDLGFEGDFQTPEEAAERLDVSSGNFRNIHKQINAYRAENTAESNAAADRLTEIDRIMVEKNRPKVQKTANAYAPYLKRFGINSVVVEDMAVGQNAYYDRKDNTVHLSSRISDTGAVGRFIVHEFTHRGAQIDMSLADSIVTAMDKVGGGRAYVSEEVIRNAYADQLAGKSAEEADSIVREERAAHFMEWLMDDADVLDEFRDNRTFLRRILDAIQDFFARNNLDKQTQIQFRRIEQKVNDLLKAANVDANVKTDGRSETNVGDEDIRMSRDLGDADSVQGDYEAAVDAVLGGTYNSDDALIVGRTPDVLQKIGLAALPVTITPNHVYSIAKTEAEAKAEGRYNKDTNYHGLGADAVKNIMKEISSPVMVVAASDAANVSKNKPRYSSHRIIAFVELKVNGKQVIAPIEVDAEVRVGNDRYDVNHVVSYYDKTNVRGILSEVIAQESTGNTAIYYGNKKRIEDFVKGSGFQLPDSFKTISDSETIIRDVGENVNRKIEDVTQSQQFKRWFGDWQNDPENTSKVVNEDGTPKVVYHGSNAEFSVFDLSQSGKNFGETSEGFFFFTNKKNAYPDSAEDYANSAAQKDGAAKVYEVYLDIKKPLRLDSRGYYTPTAYFDTNAEDVYEQYLSGDYDGVIIENSDKSADDSAIYLVDSPSKIKSATDNIGTFDGNNPDIRYSRDLETPEQRKIRRQQEQIDYLKRQFTSRTALGWAKDVNITRRETFAADIARELPGVTVDEVSVALKSVWDIQARPKRDSLDTFEKRFEEVQAAALEAARRLVDSAVRRELNPVYEQYNDLRNYLRTTPIKLNISKEDMGGASAYSEWRKGNLGLLRISDDPSARGIDSVYKEISEQYPDFFPDGITDMSEMLRRLGDVAVNLRGFAGSQYTKENPFTENREEYVNDVAARILCGFNELSRPTLTAEREQADKKYREYVREFGKQTTQFRNEIRRLNRRVDVLERRIAGRDETASLVVERRKFRRNLGKIHEEVTRPTRKKHVNQSVINTIATLLKEFDGTKLTETKIVDSAVLDKILTGLKASDPQTTKFAEAKKDKNGNITDDGVLHDEVLEMMQKQVEALKMAELALDNARAEEHPKRDNIRRLSLEYYRAANDLLKMMNGYINHANQMFVEGKIIETHEFIQTAKDELLMKRNARRDTGGNNIGAVATRGMRDLAEKLKYEYVSPAQFFSMWGETGQAIMRMFRVGQNTEMRRMERFAAFMRETVGEKYDTYAVEGSGKDNLIRVEIGDKIADVSKAQLMSLYCLWQRPAARSHLEAKGASFLDVAGKQKSDRTFLITQEVFDSLMKHLSAKDIQVAQAIQKFLSRECSSWGNEASLMMYGYEMYGEEFYFPIRVNDDVKLAKEKNWGSIAGDTNLEFSSFTNSVTPHSTSAIVIDNIFDVTENHVSRMAAYSAYAPVCHDLQQALKYGEMRDAIAKGMGEEGLKYLYDFLKRVNGNDPNRRTRSATYSWLASVGNMSKRAAVSANISTIVKQETSALRAMAMISPKYVLGAQTGVLPKSNKKNNLYGQTYQKMIEGSGAAKMKMLGYSDVGFGHTLREQWDDGFVKDGGFIRKTLTSAKFTRAALKGYDRLTDFGMLGAAKADEAVWVAIYRACELEAKDKYKGKGLTAEQITEKVNERFNDIIGETQVVDTVLDSAPFAERALGTGYGHFMNEPVKTFGQLLTAVEGLRDGRKGAKAQFAKVGAFVAVSNLIAEPMISALFSMLRDDEDDTDQAFRKFLKQYTGVDLTDTAKTDKGTTPISVLSSELMDGLFGMIPILGDITGILFDALQGFDSGRMETEALQNLVDTTKDLFFTKEEEEGKTSMETTLKKTLDWVGAIGTVTGLPFKTFIRDLSIIPKTLMNLTDNYVAQWEYQKSFYNLGNSNARSNKQFYNILSNAYQANDMDAYQYMLNDLKNTQTGKKTIGVPWNKMKKYIEDRGGKYEIGSDLWLVGIQAEFNLPSFNPAMKVETTIGKIYKNALAENVKNAGHVLPSTPGLYSYEKLDENGDNVLDENGDPVKVEMTLAEYEDFIHNVGDLSYHILLTLQNQDRFKKLSTEAQVYCHDKAYDFAARYYRSKFNPDYDLSSGDEWMAEVAKGKLDYTTISRAILKKAESKRK